MAHNIISSTGRSKLAVRVHEPYWRTLDRGRAIGFRKIAADRGTWIARMRPDDGAVEYEYKPLNDAAQAKDESLAVYARRIQARALRRAGELTKQIPATPEANLVQH
jgi:hypothetical protein